MLDYDKFVETKLGVVPSVGIAGGFTLPESLFGHQKALTSWALRRGRAALHRPTRAHRTVGD